MGNTVTKKIDPVCGMTVDSESAQSSGYQGKSYYFCSEFCQRKFDNDPKAFLSEASREQVESTESTPRPHSCCSHDGKSPS